MPVDIDKQLKFAMTNLLRAHSNIAEILSLPTLPPLLDIAVDGAQDSIAEAMLQIETAYELQKQGGGP